MLRSGGIFASPAGSRFTIVEGPADNGGARVVRGYGPPPGA